MTTESAAAATNNNIESSSDTNNDNNSNNNNTAVQRLFEDTDRFDRWKFFQDLLEGDADVHVVNQLLYAVLEGALRFPRKDANQRFVELSNPVKESIQRILHLQTDDRKVVVALLDDYTDESSQDATQRVLQQLEQVLPTMDDDPDAFRSLWDTVLEIHGREAVKYQETQDNTLQWKMQQTVARVLLHYDFLTLGIVTKPL
ncbi:hypothetical protein IV203_022623 [Nitzschia inconspicua]|uniref:Uncharacterized protein n=1 Tax=Nitzschia inconspicua TaxID=303405 RepID=A0A9K3KJ16_9STRA|nr:hypothetical protein IV203_022623 [Nitzschia inconspicua]